MKDDIFTFDDAIKKLSEILDGKKEAPKTLTILPENKVYECLNESEEEKLDYLKKFHVFKDNSKEEK